MYAHGIRKLFAFVGFVVQSITFPEDIAEVKVRRYLRYNLWCPDCGSIMSRNKVTWQSARDIPMGQAQVVMLIHEAVRGRCRNCDSYHTIHPEGIEPNAKATWGMMPYASHLCRFMPLRRVKELLPISAPTAYRWDKKVLEEQLPEPDLDDLRILFVDERSIWKHHGYVTVVLNGETVELLHVTKGKKKKVLTAFLQKLWDYTYGAWARKHLLKVGKELNVEVESLGMKDVCKQSSVSLKPRGMLELVNRGISGLRLVATKQNKDGNDGS